MCGITGFLTPSSGMTRQEMETCVRNMAHTVIHRGPDDHGVWVDETCGIALGFRRLAILDLSPGGHQPMLSANDRYVIIFNGEIYNFAEIRQELIDAGHHFRSRSDTEVMLASFCEWGVETAVRRFNGMFAFALWDQTEKVLYLVRDRIGIKPLYYGWNKNTFLFGSELKALRAHPEFEAEVNRDALALYLRYSYIPAPYSIYQGIFKLLPGTILVLKSGEQTPVFVTYWSAREVAEHGISEPFHGDEIEARQELDRILRESVRLRMIADVPLGAFLSGGVDSSTVVALMQVQSIIPVKTFTIGFHESDYDEARFARKVAAHLGTDHTELYVTPKEAMEVIPYLPQIYDEPFADSSQIPTFLVSRLARRHVTVSLSGDGGDELFAGYVRHLWSKRIWRYISWLGIGGRQAVGWLVGRFTPAQWANLLKYLQQALPSTYRQSLLADKVQKFANILRAKDEREMYLIEASHWKQPQQVVLRGAEPLTPFTDPVQSPMFDDVLFWMMYMDLVTYLPDDILVKLDRASMNVSLEARVPLLDDHRVVEFAWSLPINFKLRNGQGKWLLRQVLYQYVPAELIERPKMGFALPIDGWLKHELRDWAEALLGETRLRREGFLNPIPIRQKWQEHLSGKANWQYDIWSILLFESWLEYYS